MHILHCEVTLKHKPGFHHYSADAAKIFLMNTKLNGLKVSNLYMTARQTIILLYFYTFHYRRPLFRQN